MAPEELVRVQFQQFISEKADGNIDMNIFPAIKCNELYASQIASNDDFYATEFADDAWICPDVKEIEIYNNPFLFDTGANFVMTVNDCTVATEYEKKQGVASYSSATCMAYEDAQEYVGKVRV